LVEAPTTATVFGSNSGLNCSMTLALISSKTKKVIRNGDE
jgi:hypothetical protein